MDTQQQAPHAGIGGRREPSIDPVKAQGILDSVNKKNKYAALLWPQRWSFYSRIREIQEEEAQKIGLTLEEYRNAVRSVNCTLEPQKYPVVVDPSPFPLPPTSSARAPLPRPAAHTPRALPTVSAQAIIGRRATCPLERYGRLVKTGVDYPTRPPLKPGQIYDPYKQTLVFLGSVDGDPISFKLPPSRSEVSDDMWLRPLEPNVTPFEKFNNL